MNTYICTGNLVRDPELRNVGAKGTPVVNFTVAISRKYKRQNGEQVTERVFVPCEAWDTGAETINRHFKKGDAIVITSGSLRNDSWTDKEGNERSRLIVRVNQFEFPPNNPRRNKDDESVNNDEESGEGSDSGNDIPF